MVGLNITQCFFARPVVCFPQCHEVQRGGYPWKGVLGEYTETNTHVLKWGGGGTRISFSFRSSSTGQSTNIMYTVMLTEIGWVMPARKDCSSQSLWLNLLPSVGCNPLPRTWSHSAIILKWAVKCNQHIFFFCKKEEKMFIEIGNYQCYYKCVAL